MVDLAKLREKLAAKEAKVEKAINSGSSRYGNIFPFSALKPGMILTIRPLPDGDASNELFWREKRARTLEFPSVKQADGQIVNNKAYVEVPAFNKKFNEVIYSDLSEEYLYPSDEDVIQKVIRNFWGDDDASKALYYKFARKKTYVFQGFIKKMNEPIEGIELNKIYRFYFGEDLFNILKTFLNPEMGIENMPTDYEKGLDFILSVSSRKDGTKEFRNYAGSQWARNYSALTEEERDLVANNELADLKTFIYKRPTPEEERVMLELFDASYNAMPYDVTKWGKYFKPNNIFFDADGNIKDLKNSNPTYNKPTEVPQMSATMMQTVAPTVAHVVQPTVAPTPQTVVTPTVEHVVKPVSPTVVETEAQTAPQIIAQHSETVEGNNPNEVINNILGKYNIQKTQL